MRPMKSSGVPATVVGWGIVLPASVRARTEGLRAVWPIALLGLSVVGYMLAVRILLEDGIYTAGGGGAIDAWAYWSAAGNVRSGLPLYDVPYSLLGNYAYPPPFAQVLAPFSVLPFPVFAWLWRGAELVCLRIAVGSWRNAGLTMLLWPPVIVELDAGNVHLVMAAVLALAIARDPRWLGLGSLVKFVPVMSMPEAFVRDRRPFLYGMLSMALVVLVSVVISPADWRQYPQFLATAAAAPHGQLLDSVPLALRLTVASVVALVAIRMPRLAVVAATLAYPVMWVTSLSTLVALVAPSRAKAA